jgi:ferric-dicitrate binding protein FerR (iron transport regulator)
MRSIWAAIFFLALGASADRVIHQLAEGESLSDVAKHFLGSADAVAELASFNKLASADLVGPGDTVAIPGEERQAAIDSLRWGKVEIQRAKAIGAKTYAKPELEWAESSLEMAQGAREAGAYTQAVNLAKLAAMRALRVQDLTNERAPIQEDAIVTASSGQVDVSRDGNKWQIGTTVPVFGFVRTGPGARAIIKLPDGSVLRLREGTTLQLAYAWVDRRDGNRETVLRLLSGSLHLDFAQPEVETSSFSLETGLAAVWLRDASRLRLALDPANRVRLAVLSGSCSIDNGDDSRELAAGVGMVLPGNSGLRPPRKLLPPPASAIPANSANQLLQAAWKANDPARCSFDPNASRPHSRYHFELAQDADFLHILRETFPVGNTQNLGLLAPGIYHWRLASIDGDGVEGPSTAGSLTISPNLDVALQVDSEPAEPLPDGRVQLNGANVLRAIPAQADSSVVAIEYSVDGAAYKIMDNAIHLTEGEHQLRVRGVGPTGQRGAEQSLLLRVDASGPSVTGSAKRSESLLFGPRSEITLNTNAADVARIEYSVNGRDFATYSGPFHVVPSSTVTARAIDTLGNISATITVPTN